MRGRGETLGVVLSNQGSHFCSCVVQVRTLVSLDGELGKRAGSTKPTPIPTLLYLEHMKFYVLLKYLLFFLIYFFLYIFFTNIY